MNNQDDAKNKGWDEGGLLSPDLRHLLLLSLSLTKKEGAEFLPALDSSTLEEIRRHRLAPWVYYWVKLQGYEDRLPADLFQKLQQDYSQHLLLSTFQQKEIQEVLTTLSQAGIDCILLKGADLRRRLYGDPLLRAISDLDLLLAPEDIPRAELALTKMAYRIFLGHQDERVRINEVLYLPPENKILHVDLHWEIVAACSFYFLPYHPLRAAAVSLDYFGTPALVLSTEHLFIHLCLHTYENFSNLSQFLDLALVLSRLPLNWPQLLQEAARFGCQRPLYLVLQELTGVIPGKIPPAALAQLAAYRPTWTERMVLQPQLRYLTLALPFFYRHRSLRLWLNFIAANLWPRTESLEPAGDKSARAVHLRNLAQKFLRKLLSPDEA